MNPCTVQRGIFALRACGHDSSDTCSVCKRPLCQEHVVYQSAVVFCAKCLKEHPDPDSKPVDESSPGNAQNWNRPGWSQNWRDNYYHSYPYHPVIFYNDSYYDDFDRNSFDQRAEGSMDDQGDAVGFSDS